MSKDRDGYGIGYDFNTKKYDAYLMKDAHKLNMVYPGTYLSDTSGC